MEQNVHQWTSETCGISHAGVWRDPASRLQGVYKASIRRPAHPRFPPLRGCRQSTWNNTGTLGTFPSDASHATRTRPLAYPARTTSNVYLMRALTVQSTSVQSSDHKRGALRPCEHSHRERCPRAAALRKKPPLNWTNTMFEASPQHAVQPCQRVRQPLPLPSLHPELRRPEHHVCPPIAATIKTRSWRWCSSRPNTAVPDRDPVHQISHMTWRRLNGTRHMLLTTSSWATTSSHINVNINSVCRLGP